MDANQIAKICALFIVIEEKLSQSTLNIMKWHKSGKEEKVCLKEEMSGKWKVMGQNVGISNAKLDGFQGDNTSRMDSVISEWISRTCEKVTKLYSCIM